LTTELRDATKVILEAETIGRPGLGWRAKTGSVPTSRSLVIASLSIIFARWRSPPTVRSG
jgi:hypothetical protein